MAHQKSAEEPKNAGQKDSTRLEAERLAKEGLEEMQAGDKEDGKFVIDEARKLDPGAVEEVMRKQGKPGAADR